MYYFSLKKNCLYFAGIWLIIVEIYVTVCEGGLQGDLSPCRGLL